MIKSKITLEVKVSERSYQLLCDHESPLGEIHDALCQFKACIIEKMLDAQKHDEQIKLKACCKEEENACSKS